MPVLTEWWNRKSIRKHLKKIGALLIARYGKSNEYTPAQVKRAADIVRVPQQYLDYCFVAYCSPRHFAVLTEKMDNARDYHEAKQGVAKACFAGNTNFSADDIDSFLANAPGSTSFGGGAIDDTGGGHTDN